MDVICGIYCIKNCINQKVYIGLSKDCYKRWAQHKDGARNPRKSDEINKPLYQAMRKYGIENFSFEIIEQCDEKELKEREIYWIKYYDSYNHGYNATLGGDLPGSNTGKPGEKHHNAKLTEEEVKFCREKYKEGCYSRDIYEQYFKDRMTYGGFQSMWFGYTWKKVMPEVFTVKPHPRQKAQKEDILEMRTLYFQGISMKALKEKYADKYSAATVRRILTNKEFEPDLWPNIPDNHISLNHR